MNALYFLVFYFFSFYYYTYLFFVYFCLFNSTTEFSNNNDTDDNNILFLIDSKTISWRATLLDRRLIDRHVTLESLNGSTCLCEKERRSIKRKKKASCNENGDEVRYNKRGITRDCLSRKWKRAKQETGCVRVK